MTIYVVNVQINTTVRVDAASKEESQKLAHRDIRQYFRNLKDIFFGCHVTVLNSTEMQNNEVQPTGLSQKQRSMN